MLKRYHMQDSKQMDTLLIKAWAWAMICVPKL
jgi:hypothetical protein